MTHHISQFQVILGFCLFFLFVFFIILCLMNNVIICIVTGILLDTNLFNCLLMQIFNQLIIWQQLNVSVLVDIVKMIC